MKKFFWSYGFYFLIAAALLVVLWPLFHQGFFVSDDGEWMVIRLSAFFQSLRQGQFPVRFLGRLNHGFGYPVANFLYPGFLYFGSFIHALGFSFVDTVKIIFGVSVVGATIATFLWLRTKFSKLASSVGALSFVFAPYVAFDIYRRGSVGEIFALLPAVVGFYSLSSGKRWLFGLATGALIVSHNTLAMLFVGTYVLYMIVNGTYEFLLPLAIGIGIAGFFWLPALFEQSLTVFNKALISDPSRFFVTAENIGLIALADILVCLVFFVSSKKKWRRQDIFFLTVFVVSTLMATPFVSQLWSWPILTKLIQFPYRFLAVSSVVAPWIFAAVYERMSGGIRFALILLFLFIWLGFLVPILANVRYVTRPEGYYTTNEATTTVADEYMPQWVRVRPERRPPGVLELVKGAGKIHLRDGSTQRIEAKLTMMEGSVIQINMIYYPGWGASLDGLPMNINYQNPYGVMRMDVPAGKHTLLAEFRETPARLTADILSVISLLSWVFLAMRARSKTA